VYEFALLVLDRHFVARRCKERSAKCRLRFRVGPDASACGIGVRMSLVRIVSIMRMCGRGPRERQ